MNELPDAAEDVHESRKTDRLEDDPPERQAGGLKPASDNAGIDRRPPGPAECRSPNSRKIPGKPYG